MFLFVLFLEAIFVCFLGEDYGFSHRLWQNGPKGTILENNTYEPVVITQTDDDAVRIECKSQIKVSCDGVAVYITVKKSNVMMRGGNISSSGNGGFFCSGGSFIGNISMVTVNGRCLFNGVPAEQFQREQNEMQKKEDVEEADTSRKWTLDKDVVFTGIENKSSGDITIDTKCLHHQNDC